MGGISKIGVAAVVAIAAIAISAPARALVVYDSLPSDSGSGYNPDHVISQGYDCCQLTEIGDEITLAGSSLSLTGATISLDTWAPATITGYTVPVNSQYLQRHDRGQSHPDQFRDDECECAAKQ